MKCINNTCDKELTGRQKQFCSLACKNRHHVKKNRLSTKRKLVEYFGGKCQRCGYGKAHAALQFHHPDKNKEFGLGDGKTRSWEKALEEASKCELICANCHAEEHSGHKH